MTTTQQHLNQFYVELQAWIDGGCGEHPCFERNDSVCLALIVWAYENKIKCEPLERAIAASFVADGLDPRRPFNPTGDSWGDEYWNDGFYTNPARLAWIKAHADAAKAAGQEAA